MDSNKAVITCALTGVLTDPARHSVPVTPEEMAAEAGINDWQTQYLQAKWRWACEPTRVRMFFHGIIIEDFDD